MIPGPASSLGELNTNVGEVQQSRPVIAICRSGNRRARAADARTGLGFTADTMAVSMIVWAYPAHVQLRPRLQIEPAAHPELQPQPQ